MHPRTGLRKHRPSTDGSRRAFQIPKRNGFICVRAASLLHSSQLTSPLLYTFVLRKLIRLSSRHSGTAVPANAGTRMTISLCWFLVTLPHLYISTIARRYRHRVRSAEGGFRRVVAGPSPKGFKRVQGHQHHNLFIWLCFAMFRHV